MPSKKREQWRLPKAYREEPIVDGKIVRTNGEPRLIRMVKHENDTSLVADTFIACCDCSLVHHYTYNVFKAPDGEWVLLTRAYRLPTGMGK